MMGESYAGLSEGTCNAYSFAFKRVSFAQTHANVWSGLQLFELFQDPYYLLERRSATSFIARSTTSIR
jgi:hypothetical protein